MTFTREDWDAALLSPNVIEELDRLERLGAVHKLSADLQRIVGFGGLEEGHKDLWSHTRQVVAQTVPKIHVRWAALFHDVGKPECFRREGKEIIFHGHEAKSAWMFRNAARASKFFTSEEFETISFLIRHLGHVEEYDETWTDSAVRRVRTLAGNDFEDLLALAHADVTTKHDDKRRRHHARVADLRRRAEVILAQDSKPAPLITGLGDVLTREFHVQGRDLGDLMRRLREDVEAGRLPVQAPADVVVAYLRLRSLETS